MSAPSLHELLSPGLLDSIQDYSLLTRLAVDGFLAGIHRSVSQGGGSEFVQYRNYTPGDDLKLLDWKVLARGGRACLRTYEEETDMRCAILLDASASMGYRGARAVCSKFRYAAMVAACLAALCRRQTDQAGLFVYSDRLLSATPPGRGAGSLRRILAVLESAGPGGSGGHPLAFQRIGDFLKRRCLAVLLTDGYGQEDSLPGFLRRMRASGHDCLVCQILDRDELEFPFQQTCRIADSETGERITVTGHLARPDYLRRMHDFLEATRQTCLAYDADYLRLDTSRSLEAPLAAYLNLRESRRR